MYLAQSISSATVSLGLRCPGHNRLRRRVNLRSQSQTSRRVSPPTAWLAGRSNSRTHACKLSGSTPERRKARAHVRAQAHAQIQAEVDVAALADRAEVLGDMSLWAWRRNAIWQVVSFVVPALSISVADAMMTLVDTLCIGQFGSTAELAALGPNMVVFNFSSYVFMCVGLATITLMGRFLREGKEAEASRVVSQALIFGCLAGSVATVVITVAGPWLLAACGSTPEVTEIALVYLKIRALAIPAVVCVNAAQSGLMAQRNSARPALAVLTAALVNIVLDVIFIRNMGMGIAGAAIATVIGQFCALGMLILPYLHRDARVRLVAVLPERAHLMQFGSCVGPIFVVIAAKNVCYMLIQSAATSLQVLLVAAHQAVWSMWAVGAFCCSPMEQAALAFLPAARSGFEKRELVRMLLLGGTFVGLVAATCTCLPPLFNPQFFTRDPRLWAPMQTVCLQGFLAMTFAGLEVAVNGILLAEGETMFLARAMVTNLTITAAYFFTKGRSGALPDVWWGLVLFFFTRIVQALIRLSQISKRLTQHAKPTK
eukprot:CAMPEP_0114254866 /NCGR_PEP_ID=MMETSP0058-20121206/17238_1 /TAXON_ID=36894 /ORGANISM="Pyramimonas parkeae, CCMP726" /LENGTH=541 /DNA_ID=CAMNT_0001369175 /DNA_START=98 /DNA_END=1723 /DNA_ORIENTATION=+